MDRTVSVSVGSLLTDRAQQCIPFVASAIASSLVAVATETIAHASTFRGIAAAVAVVMGHSSSVAASLSSGSG